MHLEMASRTEWFKEFVRSLDKKAPYEDRKDLALNALRTRYGQESSLLASEDRLLGGVFQHRAGQFPWGTSKKDGEKSRKMASSRSSNGCFKNICSRALKNVNLLRMIQKYKYYYILL